MKNYFVFLTFFIWTTSSFCQEVRLVQAPEDYQLFARNEKDSANVTIKGSVADKEYKGELTLKVYKDGEDYDSQSYSVEDQEFNLTSRIYAGLHQFKFELYINRNGNNELCFSADSVVCGDAYIITGQSNSHASSSKANFSNPYCRSFGVKTGYVAYTDEHKKVRWGRATGNGPGLDGIGAWFKEIDYGVGVWGINFMQLIVEKYKVPVCLINGGSGSSSIEQNMLYPEKPSLETSFGRLAYRVNEAGLKDGVKAILWHQGESNTNEFHATYEDSFKSLLNDWKRVYKNLQKVYLFQLHPGCGEEFQSEIREVQNQIADHNDMVEIMSTSGVAGHDGCHFAHEGYVSFAERIFPLVARDFYNEKSELSITPPKMLRAFYSEGFDGSGTEITLQFDQKLTWEEQREVNGKTHYLKDQFFFRQNGNGELINSIVESGLVEGSKVILKVLSKVPLNFITYLPSKFYLNTDDIYNGPWLKGGNNIGAFSFNNRRISHREVIYSQKPADMQLYPRNKENLAMVKIKGEIFTSGFDKGVCKIYKDHELISTIEKSLSYNSKKANFEFSYPIEAGLWEYRFETGFLKDGEYFNDETFDNIVCGDVFLINGQSNSHPSRKEAIYKNEFCRSFGKNTNYSDYHPADTLWGLASGDVSQEYHVSAWGIRLMKKLVEDHKIPLCIINGGSGGSSIEYNLPKEDGLISMNSTYGRLLYRAKKAGVVNNVKALIWHQGESNSNDATYLSYADNFDMLYNAWKRDYPSIEKFYVFQIHPGCGGDRQSELREVQRKFAYRYNDVSTISTSGLQGHDGCHYTNAGYVQMGDWLHPLVAADFYNAKIDDAGSPDIVKAYYSKPGKEITLEFSKEVIWPSETGETSNMVDYLYLDGKNHVVKKGITNGNKIILTLTGKTKAATISYLPGHFYENTSNCYQGPWIFGTNGYGALSFHDFSIAK
jgi:hypothetical protein